MANNKSSLYVTNSSGLKDYLIYYSILPFIVPIIYCLYTNSMTYIGGWYVLWTFGLICILIIKFKSLVIEQKNLHFSTKSLIVFFIAVLLSFSYTTVSKYLVFDIPVRDPGIFFSMIQAMLAGNFGFSSVAGIYHFGTHQNYILLPLVPLYAIFKSPIILQLIGGMAIWGAGIMLWKISRLWFNELVSIALVLTFYTSPSNHFYGFRPELFYPLALFTLFYVCVTKDKILPILAAAIFLLSIKEDAALFMCGYVYLLFKKRKHTAAALLIILTVTIILFNLLLVQPYFVQKSHQLAADTLSFYNQWGNTNHEIALNIITSLLKVFSLMFDNNSGFWYSYGYWLFLPLLAPFLILSSILPLILFTISNQPKMHVLSEYYPIALSALAFIGTIYSCSVIRKKFPKIENKLTIGLLFLILIHNLLFVRFFDILNIDYTQFDNQQRLDFLMSAPMYRGRWQEFVPVQQQNLDDFEQLKQNLLANYKNARICATNPVYPHLDYLEFPNLQKFVGENINQPNCVNVFSIMGDFWPLSMEAAKEQITTMLGTESCKRYGNFFYCNNLTKGN